MRSIRGRIALLVALFGGLFCILLLLPPSRARMPALTVYSAEPRGAKALRLWLQELDFNVTTVETVPFRPPKRSAALLILAPSSAPNTRELEDLRDWVRGGGTLVIVAEDVSADRLLRGFGLELRALGQAVEAARPLEGAPLDPLVGEVLVRATDELVVGDSGAQPILGDGEHVFGALVAFGSGRVVALSTTTALSNEALRREDNARLALSLLGRPGAGSVAFDEVHHGFITNRQRSMTDLLLDRSWGRAALLGSLLTLGFLALHGRRLGRPIPVQTGGGRSLSEYVTSLAGLYRAGGKRAFIAEHFGLRLRRDIARTLGLPGDASDHQIAASALAAGRDAGQALRILGALAYRTGFTDAQLIELVRAGERARADLARCRIPA